MLQNFSLVDLNQIVQSDMRASMDHSVYSTIAIETIQNRDCIVVRGAHEHQSMCLYGLSTHAEFHQPKGAGPFGRGQNSSRARELAGHRNGAYVFLHSCLSCLEPWRIAEGGKITF